MHVVAVCLYIICRQEHSPHMLLDFSDALSVNVFVLGSCLLQFCIKFHIELPLIDPSLYMHRFSAELGLGLKAKVDSTYHGLILITLIVRILPILTILFILAILILVLR